MTIYGAGGNGCCAGGGRRASLWGDRGSRVSSNQMSPFSFKRLLCFCKIPAGQRAPVCPPRHINGMKHLSGRMNPPPKWISIFSSPAAALAPLHDLSAHLTPGSWCQGALSPSVTRSKLFSPRPRHSKRVHPRSGRRKPSPKQSGEGWGSQTDWVPRFNCFSGNAPRVALRREVRRATGDSPY